VALNSPLAELPQTSRAQPVQQGGGTELPAAARSIENEFSAIERALSAARYDEALNQVSKLEEHIGSNWRTRYLTGVALSGLQRWREAMAMLSLARQSNPAHARLALYLSVAQQELNLHEAALETLNQALRTHGDMPELWLNKGHSLQATGRSEAAAADYRNFLELSEHRQDLSAQRAWVQKKLETKGAW
jgi:tetratricopeptide (TPR) repeat protein